MVLDLLAIAARQGVVVVNDPVGLLRNTNKLSLALVPEEHRPRMLVSRDPGAIRRFVEREGSAVVKPLLGTRGSDVFRVEAADPNLNQIMDILTRDSFAMAQTYLPEAVEGDTRVLVLDGAALEHEGAVAAVRRIPGENDFRSNVHVGAVAAAGEYTPGIRRVVEAVAPRLAAAGLWLCGLDVIGDKVVEINVFAPGGLQDAKRFTGVDFVAPVLEAFERRAQQAQ
jgi:glutathione synthase